MTAIALKHEVAAEPFRLWSNPQSGLVGFGLHEDAAGLNRRQIDIQWLPRAKWIGGSTLRFGRTGTVYDVLIYRFGDDHSGHESRSAICEVGEAPIEETPTTPPRPRFRGDKEKVMAAAERIGKPSLTGRGAMARYIRIIAKETGVKPDTVRNYVIKRKELRPYIDSLKHSWSDQG